MKSMLRHVNDHGNKYDALMFVCPGCALDGSSGLHILPVNSTTKSPAWDFNGNFEKPTLSPSILTGKGSENVCHSFLTDGVFQFLEDSTHAFAGKEVPMPDLPDWVLDEK